MHEILFRKAHQRGIVLGVGSDAVGGMMKLYPDLYFEEMRYFVELGMGLSSDPRPTPASTCRSSS
jgi:hypothetical protein